MLGLAPDRLRTARCDGCVFRLVAAGQGLILALDSVRPGSVLVKGVYESLGRDSLPFIRWQLIADYAYAAIREELCTGFCTDLM
jgi:hypothetical protein